MEKDTTGFPYVRVRVERMPPRLADKEAGASVSTHKTPKTRRRQSAPETGGALGAARVEHEPAENSNDPLMGEGDGDAAEISAAAAPTKREGPCEAHDTGHEGARTTTVNAQGYVMTTEHGETMKSSAEITDHRRDCPKSGQVMALGHSAKRVTAERDREELVLRVKELWSAMEQSPFWNFATDFPSTVIKYAATPIEEDERAKACPEAREWAQRHAQDVEQLHPEPLPGTTGFYRVTTDPIPTKYGHRLPRNQKERDTADAELDAEPEASRAVDGQRWRLAALKEVSKFQAALRV